MVDEEGQDREDEVIHEVSSAALRSTRASPTVVAEVFRPPQEELKAHPSSKVRANSPLFLHVVITPGARSSRSRSASVVVVALARSYAGAAEA